MPMIFCGICDWYSNKTDPFDQLREVLKHEENEHQKYHMDTLKDAMFDREMDNREEDAKLKMILPDEEEFDYERR